MNTSTAISLRGDVAAWSANALHVISDANARIIARMITSELNDDTSYRGNGQVGLNVLAGSGRVAYRYEILRDLDNLDGVYRWPGALGALREWLENGAYLDTED